MSDLELDLENLLFDLENPRFNGLPDQRAALQQIVENQGEKLWKLAQDIARQGLNPTERVSVIRDEKGDNHVVVEGNRRLAASKLLCNPARLNDMNVASSLKARLKKLAEHFDLTLVDPMLCVLFDSREEANHWIELRHTGENEGAGIVPWDGQATARFRGNNSSFQALEFVRGKGVLSDDVNAQLENFPITNLDRLLGDPDVRAALGLKKIGGKLQSSVSSDHLARALGRIVTEIAMGTITVSDIKRKDDRTRYLDRIRDDLPDQNTSSPILYDLSSPAQRGGNSQPTKIKPNHNRSAPTSSNRDTLIPRGCIIFIEESRIDNVYKELRGLDVVKKPNAVAVLSRVFLEMSVNHYMKTFGLSGKDELKPRIDLVCNDLQNKKVDKDILKAIRLATSQPGAPFSIDLLNGYVHNKFVHPDANSLKTAWDSVQPFFVSLWQQVKLHKSGTAT